MFKWLRTLIVLVVVALGAQVVLAQTGPSQIDFALEALSERVGAEVTLDDLDGWRWAGETYGDTSLGCPEPDQAYAQVATPGYQFLLAYQGDTYDYRVSQDGSIVVLCTIDDAIQPTIVPVTPQPGTDVTPVPTVPPTAAPAVDCPAGLELRLTVGQQARTTVGLPSNLRAQPDVNAEQLGQVEAGSLFTVMDGPVCGPTGLYWWQIQTDTLTGWIAQGDQGLYYIEPIPQPLPAADALTPLTGDVFGQLAQLSAIAGNLQGAVAWSPDGTTLAVGNSNTTLGGVWLYDVNQFQNPPLRLETDTLVTAVTYTPDGAYLIIGDVDGNVEFWDVLTEEMTFSFNANIGTIEALSVSANGRILATVGDNNVVQLWGIPAPTAG